jgi:predicted nucleotidyltransferase/predicted transcriptional regulator with HTH domain
MSFNKILPLTKSRLEILFEIYSNKKIYLREISRNLKMNPSLVFRILKILNESKILGKEKKGKEIFYFLKKNESYNFLVSMLEKYHLEKIVENNQNLKDFIKSIYLNEELLKSSDLILIFGSQISGDFNNISDIDVLFVNENKNLVIQKCQVISVMIGKEINPVIYKKRKFKIDINNNEPFLSSIIKNIKNRITISN